MIRPPRPPRALAPWGCLGFLTLIFLPACATLAPAAGPAAVAPADSTARSLVVIEFADSPPNGLEVTAGLLGVPDSTGAFPTPYQRSDPVTGQFSAPGLGFGDDLVFTDLAPGSYRIAMVFLGESGLARRLFPKNRKPLEDRCTVYGDTIAALTFNVKDGDVLYLGRLVRRSRPSMGDRTDLWETWVDWEPGDERKVLKGLIKRKPLAAWRPLLKARARQLDARKP